MAPAGICAIAVAGAEFDQAGSVTVLPPNSSRAVIKDARKVTLVAVCLVELTASRKEELR